MTKTEDEIIKKFKNASDKKYKEWTSPILQVQKGGYGEGDKLYGIRVPRLRQFAKEYSNIDDKLLEKFLSNPYHEARMFALFVMINKLKKSDCSEKKYVDLYLKNAKYINNWDLVDCSAPNILGKYLWNNKKELFILNKLSETNHLWSQRIAIVSTLYFIKQNYFEPTIDLCNKYISHPHHLIHKASGWLLREMGKKDVNELYKFLDTHAKDMPRVMLRYSLEKLNKDKKNYYMNM